MKKIFISALALMLIICIVACTRKDKEEPLASDTTGAKVTASDTTNTTNTETTATEPITSDSQESFRTDVDDEDKWDKLIPIE